MHLPEAKLYFDLTISGWRLTLTQPTNQIWGVWVNSSVTLFVQKLKAPEGASSSAQNPTCPYIITRPTTKAQTFTGTAGERSEARAFYSGGFPFTQQWFFLNSLLHTQLKQIYEMKSIILRFSKLKLRR